MDLIQITNTKYKVLVQIKNNYKMEIILNKKCRVYNIKKTKETFQSNKETI